MSTVCSRIAGALLAACACVGPASGAETDLSLENPALRSSTIHDHKIYYTPDGTSAIVVAQTDNGDFEDLWHGVLSGTGPAIWQNIRLVTGEAAGIPFTFAADGHVRPVLGTDTAWLSWVCAAPASGGGKTAGVCVMTSPDGGRTFDFSSLQFFVERERLGSHEPQVVCNDPDDCTVFYTTQDATSKVRARRYVSGQWCPASTLTTGSTLFGQLVLPTGAPAAWEYYALDTSVVGVFLEPVAIFHQRMWVPGCEGGGVQLSPPALVESPFLLAQNLNPAPYDFRYTAGTAAVLSPGQSRTRWLIHSIAPEGVRPAALSLQRLSADGVTELSRTVISSARYHYIGGSLSFDPIRRMSYLFYFRVKNQERLYDICLRTASENSSEWSSELCPVTQIKGKATSAVKGPGYALHGIYDNFPSSGAVYDGRMSLLYQGRCNDDPEDPVCSLLVYQGDDGRGRGSVHSGRRRTRRHELE